jgi:hypothetical protein
MSDHKVLQDEADKLQKIISAGLTAFVQVQTSTLMRKELRNVHCLRPR